MLKVWRNAVQKVARAICALLFLTLIFSPVSAPPRARAQENVQIFGPSEPLSQETDKGRNPASCLAGLRQFFQAGIGFEDLTDYVRDFFLWPSHYADVANVQDQLNRTRYQVVSAFMRCDIQRLPTITESYYRLEAELYFLRHFVDTGSGFAKILTESPGAKKKFEDEMVDYMILTKITSENEDLDRARYRGYFDLFTARYAERAKTYASFGNDPVFEELSAKVDELVDTFKSFSKLGSEIHDLTNEAIIEPATAIKNAAVAVWKEPGKSLKAGVLGIIKKFDACAETPDNRYCLTGEDNTGSSYGLNIFGNDDPSNRKTFEDVSIAIEKQAVKKTEDKDQAEVLAKYELLYGQVNGEGITAIIENMDKLLALLREGRPADQNNDQVFGSLSPLQRVAQCAEQVKGNVCK